MMLQQKVEKPMPEPSCPHVTPAEGLGSLLWFLSKAVLFLVLIVFSVIIAVPSAVQGGVASSYRARNTSMSNLEQRAVSAYLNGDTLEAEKWCSALDGIDIQNTTAFLIRIMLLEDLGGREQARTLYEELIQRDTANRWACARLGRILVEDGCIQRGKLLIEKSLEGKPVFADSYVAQACYFASIRSWKMAVSAIERASMFGASPLLSEIRKFNYLLHLESYEKAEKSVKRMREICPFLPVIGFLQGRLYFLRGNTNKAADFLKGYIRSSDAPADLVVDALKILASISERNTDFTGAAHFIEKALVISRDNSLAVKESLKRKLNILHDRMELRVHGVKTQSGPFSILHRDTVSNNILASVKQTLANGRNALACFYEKAPEQINVVVLESLSNDVPAFFDVYRGEVVLSAPAFSKTMENLVAEKMVVHELSHVYLHNLTGTKAFRRINLWAIEGLAEFHSLGPVKSLNEIENLGIGSGNDDFPLFGIEELGTILSVDEASDNEKRRAAYLQARLMVQFVSGSNNQEGIEKIVKLMRMVGKNISVDEAFTASFNANTVKFAEMSKSFVNELLKIDKRAALMLQ